MLQTSPKKSTETSKKPTKHRKKKTKKEKISTSVTESGIITDNNPKIEKEEAKGTNEIKSKSDKKVD